MKKGKKKKKTSNATLAFSEVHLIWTINESYEFMNLFVVANLIAVQSKLKPDVNFWEFCFLWNVCETLKIKFGWFMKPHDIRMNRGE